MNAIRLTACFAFFLAMPALSIATARATPLYNAPAKAETSSPVATPITAPSGTMPKTQAETAPAQAATPPSAVTLHLARAVGTVCPEHWDSPACLSAVSTANLMLASSYGATLQEQGHKGEAEQIKQHCAAATAAREKDYPAYAMKSAFIECANTITDIAGKTGVKPDPSMFQLLIAPTLCLSNDPRCGAISDQLKRFSAH